MLTSRRTFIGTSLAAGGLVALGAAGSAGAMGMGSRVATARGGKARKMLILGGTGFLGPHVIDAARAAGMEVTLFNRGITEVRKQTPIDGVEKLVGDRDPNVGEGLKALEGRKWDVVVDTSGYVPRIVKASADLLAPNVGQYIFISTLSVYAENSQGGKDESAPLATMEDPTNEEVRRYYGALKALCEQAAETAMPGRVANIRPGFIVGPGDPTDRFTYWPVRFDRGGDVLVPGSGEDPVQFIDVRDLAAWVVQVAQSGTMGEFNATGPVEGCTVGKLVEACQAAASRPSQPVYVDPEFLESQGVGGGVVTILIPPRGDYAGFHQRSIAKAAAAGLKTRPVLDTVRDTLAWWPVELERRVRVTADMIAEAERENRPPPQMADPEKLRAGLEPEREEAILTAWRQRAR